MRSCSWQGNIALVAHSGVGANLPGLVSVTVTLAPGPKGSLTPLCVVPLSAASLTCSHVDTVAVCCPWTCHCARTQTNAHILSNYLSLAHTLSLSLFLSLSLSFSLSLSLSLTHYITLCLTQHLSLYLSNFIYLTDRKSVV